MENTVAQSKTEKKVSKIDKFLSKFGVYAVLTIIVFAIFLIMLNIVDAYPFGDLFTVANGTAQRFPQLRFPRFAYR